jgi:hypothetical protein
MRHLRMTTKLFVPMLATALVFAACSKQETPPEQKPEPSKPEAGKTTETPKPATAPAASPSVAKPTMPPTSMPQPSADATKAATDLESSYVSNPDFSVRVQVIYKLSDLATPEAISALGRVFQTEKDPDLRTEVLDSLYDIDGLDDKKAVVLAAGAAADQPKEVRESAIDGLGDIDAKQALPILQALLNDPDPEIREAAKDAIEQLQATMNNP